MANIKFFRVDSNYWKNKTPLEGYIWFNTDDRTIQLYKGTNWEKYSGIIDAKFENSILTITPAVGNAVTVNLSDMASASTLSTLSSNFNNLQTNFNTLSGEFNTVKGTVNTTSAAVATIIKQLKDIAEEEQAVKKYVDNKMSAHETARQTIDEGFNSRISTLETTTGTHTTDIAGLKDLVGTTAVATQISTAINALDNGTNGVSDTGEKVTVTVKQVDGKVTSVTVSESDIASAQSLSDLTTTVTNNKTAVDEALGGSYNKTNTVAAAIQAAANAAAAAQADIDSFLKVEEVADAAIDTLKEIQEWIANDETGTAALIGRVSANETAISTLNGKVDVTKVSTAISTAKQEAINAAASDAATKANNAKTGAISEANDYTDTELGKLADGAVKTNTTDIATIKGDITTIKGQITTINTTIEENELVVSEALNDLNTRVDNLASGTVSSVTGENYITTITTDGAVTVSATTGAVANGDNALALASDVKSYVDAC